MDFDEFCAAALSVHQLEALDGWEQHARCAYEIFEEYGNRKIMIEELASVYSQFEMSSLSITTEWELTSDLTWFSFPLFQEFGISPCVPVHAVLNDWIRHTDGKLSFRGYMKLLHGVPPRSLAKVVWYFGFIQNSTLIASFVWMSFSRIGVSWQSSENCIYLCTIEKPNAWSCVGGSCIYLFIIQCIHKYVYTLLCICLCSFKIYGDDISISLRSAK